MSHRVKGSSGDALNSLVPPQRPDATDDFAGRAAGEGEEQYAIGGHAAF
jgi:hypothetical protein